MKHHYNPFSYDRSQLQGLARVAIQEGDAHSTCTRCGVMVRVAKGRTGKHFWVGGTWVSKVPARPPKDTRLHRQFHTGYSPLVANLCASKFEKSEPCPV